MLCQLRASTSVRLLFCSPVVGRGQAGVRGSWPSQDKHIVRISHFGVLSYSIGHIATISRVFV